MVNHVVLLFNNMQNSRDEIMIVETSSIILIRYFCNIVNSKSGKFYKLSVTFLVICAFFGIWQMSQIKLSLSLGPGLFICMLCIEV